MRPGAEHFPASRSLLYTCWNGPISVLDFSSLASSFCQSRNLEVQRLSQAVCILILELETVGLSYSFPALGPWCGPCFLMCQMGRR